MLANHLCLRPSACIDLFQMAVVSWRYGNGHTFPRRGAGYFQRGVLGTGDCGTTPPWSIRYTGLTGTFTDFSGNGFTHLRPPWRSPFGPPVLTSDFRLTGGPRVRDSSKRPMPG